VTRGEAQRQGPETDNDGHDGSFRAEMQSSAQDRGRWDVPTAPKSRPGRYADLDTSQLADVVERAHESAAVPDRELVFELTRLRTTESSCGLAARPLCPDRSARLGAPNAGWMTGSRRPSSPPRCHRRESTMSSTWLAPVPMAAHLNPASPRSSIGVESGTW